MFHPTSKHKKTNKTILQNNAETIFFVVVLLSILNAYWYTGPLDMFRSKSDSLITQDKYNY